MMRFRFLAAVTIIVTAIGLGGCSSMQPKDFSGNYPELKMEEFFVGKVRGVGAFFDRFGRLRREFVIDAVGTKVDSETIEIAEDLRYSDGEALRRVYRFRKVNAHHFIGEGTNGVVGEMTAEQYGNAVRWKYRLLTPVGGREWVFSFDDWFFLLDDGLVLNRGRASKWGIHVGDIMMTLRRVETP